MALKIVSGLDATSLSLSSFLDLQKNELRSAQIHNLNTTQINGISSPASGQFAYDTTLNKLKVYNGTVWELVGAAADGSTLELSSNTLSIKATGVGTTQLAAGAVTTAKIGDAQVTGAKIAGLTVATGNIAATAVTSAKLADGAVGTAKLATDAVTTAKIADAQITTALIATDAVTAAKIADNSIDVARLNTSDGSNGQFLKTNGSGTLSFATPVDDSVSATNLTATLAGLDTTHAVNVHGSGSTDIIIGSSSNTPNVKVTGDVIVDGDLTVGGTTTTINSTTVTIDDPIFTLGGDTAPSSDDNKDRGIEFRYHDGTNAKLGFFGYDDSTRKFTGYTAATNTSEVFSGTLMDAAFGSLEATGFTLSAETFNYAGTVVSATGAELNYVDGVTSNIQTQLNAKQATVTGAATTITGSNLTASRALVSNSSGKVAVSAVTSTEVGYLDGVTSAIQTQLNAKPVAYAGEVTTSGGTASILKSTHGLGFPANVQVYDENKQLVLVDIRQTVSGTDMTIVINAPDATYTVVAVAVKVPESVPEKSTPSFLVRRSSLPAVVPTYKYGV